MIDTKEPRCIGEAFEALRANDSLLENHSCNFCTKDISSESEQTVLSPWSSHPETKLGPAATQPQPRHALGRGLDHYPLASGLAPWVKRAMANFHPESRVIKLVKQFSATLHATCDAERQVNSGLHDIDMLEYMYQVTLHAAAAILIAAEDAAVDAMEPHDHMQSSKAGEDDHLSSWGRLLCGIECTPPIVALPSFYFMMCQAFTFGVPPPSKAEYIYAAMTAVDYAKGKNKFSKHLADFYERAYEAQPDLDGVLAGQDRSYWRMGLSYVTVMNKCETSRQFRAPRKCAIPHNLNKDMVLAMRGIDGTGALSMGRNGATWFDIPGYDSLINATLLNDVLDLHTDIKTGASQNLLRLLLPGDLNLHQAKVTVSIMLAASMCEILRGHARARFQDREDGRCSAASGSYSFGRCRHRRIFETLEMYSSAFPKFWTWTWEIWRMAKEQVTEAGLSEPLVCALKRAAKQEVLNASPPTAFYKSHYELVERTTPLPEKQPLGVSDNIAELVRNLHHSWHGGLRAEIGLPGWGRRLDEKSDRILGSVGEFFCRYDDSTDEMYKFAVAFGKLGMSLPFVAYHTIDAIIIAFGVL